MSAGADPNPAPSLSRARLESSSRNTRDFSSEICAKSEIRLHREYNLAMKNKRLRRIADVLSGGRSHAGSAAEESPYFAYHGLSVLFSDSVIERKAQEALALLRRVFIDTVEPAEFETGRMPCSLRWRIMAERSSMSRSLI